MSSDLTWTANTHNLCSKARQRLFFLRKLSQFRVDRTILLLFYDSVVQSIAIFGFVVWWRALTVKDKKLVQSIHKAASKIIGCSLPTIDSIYTQRVVKKVNKILSDDMHPLKQWFHLLPSGRRVRSAISRTVRLNNSVIPQAIVTYNKSK